MALPSSYISADSRSPLRWKKKGIMRSFRKKPFALFAFSLLFFAELPQWTCAMEKQVYVRTMTREELKASLLLGNPDLMILDVRIGKEWRTSKEKIQGAIRENPEKVKNWVDQYPKNKTLVLYSSGPNDETGSRIARQLMARGFIRVYVLKGGWKEWKEAGFSVEPSQ